jgi:hypothetical protein
MTLKPLHLPLFAALIMALAPTASAEAKAVGKFRSWSVFTETIGGDTLCYAATPATSKSPAKAAHGEVWFYVTNWKSGAATGQPSLKTGFELDPASTPKVKIGRSSWNMFAAGREAFADDSDDASIVKAIKQGEGLRVEGRSGRGTTVAYQFSLSGSTAAIEKAAASCK